MVVAACLMEEKKKGGWCSKFLMLSREGSDGNFQDSARLKTDSKTYNTTETKIKGNIIS